MKSIIILALVLALVIALVLVFIYMSACIVIVKQGTRKIVERLGSYRTTLSEGAHVIFRPFDKIAPVPWEVLSVSQREDYKKNLDKLSYREEDFERGRKIENELINLINRDIREKLTDKYCVNAEVDIKSNGAEALEFEIDEIVFNLSGKKPFDLVSDAVKGRDIYLETRKIYKELGIVLSSKISEQVKEQEALYNAVKYYPRHQDKKSAKKYRYPLAENDILDYVDLRERHIDTEYSEEYGSIKLITKDNASIKANLIIFFNITDPYMYYYGADEPEKSMVLLCITTLRNMVANMTLEEALGARNVINSKIRELLDDATNNWGIKANRVEIKDFNLEENMRIAMDKVLIAEREKRSLILAAEGKAHSIEIVRNAEAEGYKKIRDANLSDAVLKIRGYEALKDVADGKSTKIFMPNDLSNLISGSHVLADAFKEEKVVETDVDANK